MTAELFCRTLVTAHSLKGASTVAISKYAWMPDEPLPDSAEKRFVLAAVIQTVHDAQRLGSKHVKDVGEMDELSQWIADDRFVWWCEVLGLPAHRMSSIIMDVLRGRWKVNTYQLVKGSKSPSDYDNPNGFTIWEDKEKHQTVSSLAGKINQLKRRNARKQSDRNEAELLQLRSEIKAISGK